MSVNSTDQPDLVMTVYVANPQGGTTSLQLQSSGGKNDPTKDPNGYGIKMVVPGTITFELKAVGRSAPYHWTFPTTCPAPATPLTPGNYFGIDFSQVSADIVGVNRKDDLTVIVTVDPTKAAGSSLYQVVVDNGRGGSIRTNDPAIKDGTSQ